MFLRLFFLSHFSVSFGFFQFVKQWLAECLENICKLIEDSIFCIVSSCVIKDLDYIALKQVSLLVVSFVQILPDLIKPHWLCDDSIVIRSLSLANRLSKWPCVFMIPKRLKNILALLFKCFFFCPFRFFIICLRPPSFKQSLYLIKLKVICSFLVKVKRIIDSLIDHRVDFRNDELPLLLDDAADVLVVDTFVYLALHHRRPRVVFDVPFPPGLRHLKVLRKTLLPEILDCVVVSVSHEVLDTDCLGMCFQSIHQSCSVSFDLLRC